MNSEPEEHDTHDVLSWLTFDKANQDGLPGLGSLVEGHRLEAELGCGGSGVVFLAHHIELDRKVAFKVSPIPVATEVQVERYRAEARMLARLHHPNIVEVHDAGVEPNYRWIAMEWVEGKSLSQHLNETDFSRTDRSFSHRSAELLEEIALGLAAAHEGGVVHGDLKPSNILIDESGAARLIDFGLAQASEEHATRSGAVPFQGTPAFAAPEQKQTGKRNTLSDIYSFGRVALAVLTGSLEHHALDRQRVPHDLREIVKQCLEARPSRRYPTAGALAQDLQRFLQHEPVSAAPRSILSRAALAIRRRPKSSAVAVLFIALMSFSGAVWDRMQRLGEQVADRELDDELSQARRAFDQGEFHVIDEIATRANADLLSAQEWQQIAADAALAKADYADAITLYEELREIDTSAATELGLRLAKRLADGIDPTSRAPEPFALPAVDQPEFRDCFMRVLAYQRVIRNSDQSLIAWAEQALSIRPLGNATVLRGHAAALASSGRRGEAIDLLGLAIRLSPNNRRAREARCSLLTSAARFTEAEQEISRAIRHFGQKARWIERRVALHTTTGNLALLRESTRQLENFIDEQVQSDFSRIVTLALANARLGLPERAEHWLRRCQNYVPSRELGPRGVRALNIDQILVEANVAIELHQLQRSRSAYMQANDPDFPRFQPRAELGLAFCAYYLEGPQAALDRVMPLCAQGFGNVAAISWALECGEAELARDLAEDALHRDPENARLLVLASMSLLANDDHSEAFRLAGQAQRTNPDHFDTNNWLAYVHAKCNWPEKAVQFSAPYDPDHYWDEHEAVLRVATLLSCELQQEALAEFELYRSEFSTERLLGACARLPACPPILLEWARSS